MVYLPIGQVCTASRVDAREAPVSRLPCHVQCAATAVSVCCRSKSERYCVRVGAVSCYAIRYPNNVSTGWVSGSRRACAPFDGERFQPESLMARSRASRLLPFAPPPAAVARGAAATSSLFAGMPWRQRRLQLDRLRSRRRAALARAACLEPARRPPACGLSGAQPVSRITRSRMSFAVSLPVSMASASFACWRAQGHDCCATHVCAACNALSRRAISGRNSAARSLRIGVARLQRLRGGERGLRGRQIVGAECEARRLQRLRGVAELLRRFGWRGDHAAAAAARDGRASPERLAWP